MSALELRQAWDEFTAVLAARAPVSRESIRPPRADVGAALDRAEATLGLALGEDLRTWFALHDGVDDPSYWVVPDGGLVGVNAAVSSTQLHRTIGAEYDDPDERAAGSTQPAVTMSGCWLPEYVVYADDTCGDVGFVDLRAGEWHGAARRWWKADADLDEHEDRMGGPVAADLTALLTAVTGAIAGAGGYPGRPVEPNGQWSVQVVDGRVVWHGV